MARRGRFTSPNSGGQNLSALIVSLLRERKSAEEQLLLEKFRNKQVTAEEVQAFYDNWASTSGYTEGTLEYDQLNQRKKNAYDTGIKYKYDDLISTFNSTGGKNYTELMNFLNGTAQTVNDKTVAQQYLDLRKNVTNNFINDASEQLKQGTITIEEFRKQVDAGISSSFAKGSKEYNDARYSAFVAEYNGAYSTYKNRVDAGKSGAYAAFTSFLNTMKSRMAAEGLSGDLGARIDSDLVSVRAAGRTAAATAEYKRTSDAQNVLTAIYDAALSVSGVPGADLTAEQIAAGKTHTIADIISNPGAIADFVRLVETGVADIPQSLKDAYGITSVEDLKSLMDRQIRTIESSTAAANAVNPTDNNAQWASLGKALARTVGSRTQVDEVSDAMNQFALDIQNAGASGDDIAIARATNEWKKFLSGAKSDYGQINRDSLNADLDTYGTYGTQFKTALSNTEKALSGQILGQGDQSLEDFFGIPAGFSGKSVVTFGQTYADGSIPESLVNYNLLITGKKVQVVTRDPQTGAVTRVTTDPIATGPTGFLGNTKIASKQGGYLNVITYVTGANGEKVPVVQSIAASGTIQTGNGTASTTWGYQYQLESGKMIYVSTTGASYDTNPFQTAPKLSPDGNGVYFVDTPAIASGVTQLDSAPAVDVDSIVGTPGTKSFIELNKIADELDKLANDPAWVGSLGLVDQTNIARQVSTIRSTAKTLEIQNTQILLSRAIRAGASQDEINRLQGQVLDLQTNGVNGYNYQNFVKTNPDRYEQVEPGLWKLKEPTGPGGSAGGYALGYGRNVDAQGRELPSTVDLRTPKPTLSTPGFGQTAGGYSPYLANAMATQGFQPGSAAPKAPDFFRNTPAVPTGGPTSLQAGGFGAIPSAPAPIAPTPLVPAAMTPFNAADREERRALIAGQSQTTAPVPPPPAFPTRIGGK